jgi:hypothetical protein
MIFKRALALALASAVLLPASALAQEAITPPDGDNYLSPIFINSGTGLKTGDELGIAVDTTNYTVQDDLFNPGYDQNSNPVPGSGGGREPTTCEPFGTPYGNTIWSVFRASQYGVVDISAASGTFDEVIRVVPFGNPSTDTKPQLPGTCFDNIAGSQQSASGLVFPNQWFAVQVGGTPTQTSPAQGGPMQIKFALGPPPKIDGDALLFWQTGPLRVTSLTAQGVTKGAKVTVTCTKHACKTIKKTASKLLSGSSPAFRPVAHEAKTKFLLLKNRKVKKGATITLRITAPGFIGKHFFWKVKKNKLTNKKVSCLNPGSSKPHSPGKCHG